MPGLKTRGPMMFDQYWDDFDDCPICQNIKMPNLDDAIILKKKNAK